MCRVSPLPPVMAHSDIVAASGTVWLKPLQVVPLKELSQILDSRFWSEDVHGRP
jgi:hypothetical protein